MTNFPGPDNYSAINVRNEELARTSPAFRDSTEGSRHLTGSSFEPVHIQRTPDADDFIDALRLRARMVEGGCTRTNRTVHMLNTAADKMRATENLIDKLYKRIKELEAAQ